MILTGKKIYNNVPVSIIKEYRDKIAPFHSGSHARNFHPVAQRKISETFAPLDAITNEAMARYNATEVPAEKAAIAAETHTVTVFEIDTATEWTAKNIAAQITELRDAKMIADYELPTEE